MKPENNKKCDCDICDAFPYYGVAHHECYWIKPGGFEGNQLGTSTIYPLEKWPDNFLAEIDRKKDIRSQLRYGLCGVYYCPSCKSGMVESETLLSKRTIELLIIFQDGVQARSHNKNFLDNPFLDQESLPEITGEPVEARGEKCAAWNDGWKCENLLRDLG